MKLSTPPSTAASASPTRFAVCFCGQDLDVARGRHCPRCGTTLGHAVAPHVARDAQPA